LIYLDPVLQGSAILKFIHIPKNAGSTVEEAGRNSGFFWGMYDLSGSIMTANQPSCDGEDTFWHRIPTGVNNASIHTFCVVRDPIARALSEMRFELTYKWDDPDHVWDDTRCVDKKWLNTKIQSSSKNMIHAKYVCHWLPQYKYVRNCDHVLLFERLEENLQELANYYNFKLNMSVPAAMNDRQKLGRCDIDESDLFRETHTLLMERYSIDYEILRRVRSDPSILFNNNRLNLKSMIAANQAVKLEQSPDTHAPVKTNH